jgi:hypothetical protein
MPSKPKPLGSLRAENKPLTLAQQAGEIKKRQDATELRLLKRPSFIGGTHRQASTSEEEKQEAITQKAAAHVVKSSRADTSVS